MVTGRLMSWPGWDEIMDRVWPQNIIVVPWLDRFSYNFDEDVRTQAELTKQNIA